MWRALLPGKRRRNQHQPPLGVTRTMRRALLPLLAILEGAMAVPAHRSPSLQADPAIGGTPAIRLSSVAAADTIASAVDDMTAYYANLDESTERARTLVAHLQSQGITRVRRIRAFALRLNSSDLTSPFTSEATSALLALPSCQRRIAKEQRSGKLPVSIACSAAEPHCCVPAFFAGRSGPCSHADAYWKARGPTWSSSLSACSAFAGNFLTRFEMMRTAARDAERSGWRGLVLMLEDDARLVQGFRARLTQQLASIPSSTRWHILKLHGGGTPSSLRPPWLLPRSPGLSHVPVTEVMGVWIRAMEKVGLVPHSGAVSEVVRSESLPSILLAMGAHLDQLAGYDMTLIALHLSGQLVVEESTACLAWPSPGTSTTFGANARAEDADHPRPQPTEHIQSYLYPPSTCVRNHTIAAALFPEFGS